MSRDRLRTPDFYAGDATPADPLRKRGSAAETTRALRAWTRRNPNPFAPRRAAARKTDTQANP